MPPPPLPPLPAPPTVALSRGLPSTTTGVLVFDVAALATMSACLPTLRLFGRKRRWVDLVSVGREASNRQVLGRAGAAGTPKLAHARKVEAPRACAAEPRARSRPRFALVTPASTRTL